MAVVLAISSMIAISTSCTLAFFLSYAIHPQTRLQLIANRNNAMNGSDSDDKNGEELEEYITKRSTFEPNAIRNNISNHPTPWPNYYSSPNLNRSIPEQVSMRDPSTRYIPVWKGRNLIRQPVQNNNHEHEMNDNHLFMTTDAVFVPHSSTIDDILSRVDTIACHVGSMNGMHYFSLDMSPENDENEYPSCLFLDAIDSTSQTRYEYKFEQLRSIGGTLTNDDDAALLATARGLSVWHRSIRFCSKCGSPNVHSRKMGTSRQCQDCLSNFYPRIDPSMMALITTTTLGCTVATPIDEYILMGRKSIWPKGRYSILAGFTELGETLEETVLREVWEESGVRVDKESLTFYQSQTWPFPRSLMFGFHGTAQTAPDAVDDESQPLSLPEITVDTNEMEDIRWFSKQEVRDALLDNSDSRNCDKNNITLNIPGRASLAHKMIHSWIQQ